MARPKAHFFTSRRAGDVAILYADPSKANLELAWKTTRDMDTICADTWRWQSANPGGYDMAVLV